ncbi:MAG: carboxymuconolactone decarboxylase family protein [Candidatus Dormibacteraceae bacterium]
MPAAVAAMIGLQMAADQGSLEPKLIELVKMRASQLNGCAYCLDMHSKDARAIGEEEQRLAVLAAWREAPFFGERERAALAWCESLTLLSSWRPGMTPVSRETNPTEASLAPASRETAPNRQPDPRRRKR